MHHTKAVLRRAAAERRMIGTERQRDNAIERFLDELTVLFTPTLIGRLEDDVIAGMYEDWIRSLEHLDYEQRLTALVQDIRLCKVPFLIYRTQTAKLPEEVAPAPNVVSLHAR